MRAVAVGLLAAMCAVAQKVEPDIVYSGKQTLDLYTPAGRGFTTVVYTYGGGWHSGSGKSSKPIAEMLVSLGYGCALVSHRLWPPDLAPAQAEDVAAAFAWVKKSIGARGGDPNRLVLAGHSSGAQLSLLVASDGRYLAAHRLSAADVRAVIGLSAPVDLTSRGDGGRGYGDVLMAGRGADAFGRDPAIMKSASPIEHVTRALPPTLVIVGERDFPMLAADARAYAAKATGRVEIEIAAGKDHMGTARGMATAGDPVLERVKKFLEGIGN